MQNYRETGHQNTAATRDVARPLRGPRVSPRQLLCVILAAVLVATLLTLFSLLATRLYPNGGDCVLTDNVGCLNVGSVGSGGDSAGGVVAGLTPVREG